MAIEAVLFDFSGTLFCLEADETWAEDLADSDGRAFGVAETTELMLRMTTPISRTDRHEPFDAEIEAAWKQRDLDPALHRKAYLEVLRRAGVTGVRAERLYGRLIGPGSWTPYPDTEDVLKTLVAQDVAVAIVSNIAFDVRPAFAARGWDRWVDSFVLSFEVGAIKPDPRIFQLAVDAVGAPAEATLMVGDSAAADGGATALGCDFALVDPLPTAQRPDALLRVLRDHGLG